MSLATIPRRGDERRRRRPVQSKRESMSGRRNSATSRELAGGAKAAADNGYRIWHIRLWHGMTTARWLSLLAKHRFRIAPKGIGLACTVAGVSLADSVLAAAQSAALGGKIRRVQLQEPPIFIIGHWRSGTTHLHELLVRDERLGFADTYECLAPSHALLTGSWLPGMLSWLVPSKRPMDNMSFGWRRPQEDEFALFALGAESPYERIVFPNEIPAGGEDFEFSSAEAEANWRRTLQRFLGMVQLRGGKRIVLKSPPHTARVRLLAEMFPGAKFLHVVRDPQEVFPSTVRLWKTLWETQGVQKPDYDRLEEYVFGTFERMYARFEAERSAIAPGCYAEVKYHDLVAEPLAELQRVYGELGLEGFADARPRVESFVESLGEYQRNRHRVPPERAAEIARRWGPLMAPYGFETPEFAESPA